MLELKNIKKKKVKILGIGGGKVSFTEKKSVPIVLVLYRVPIIEQIYTWYSKIDNKEFTEDLINEITKLSWKREIKVIVSENIFLAGLSLLDLDLIAKRLSIPVIAVFRKKPVGKKILKTIEKISDLEFRLYLKEAVNKYSNVHLQETSGSYFISRLIDQKSVSYVLKNITLHGKIPEPVRIASLFSKSITI